MNAGLGSALRRWVAGFGYALEGVLIGLRTQRNMRFHLAAASLALLLAMALRLPMGDLLWVLTVIALVISAELMNTAVEHAVNLAMPDLHPLAKIAKDTAAAAVLVLSVLAAAVGLLVFGGPLLDIWKGEYRRPEPDGLATIASVSVFVLLVWCALRAWCEHGERRWKPGGLSCAAAVLIVLWAPHASSIMWPVTAAVLLASLLLLVVPMLLRKISLINQVTGLLIGAALTWAALLIGGTL